MIKTRAESKSSFVSQIELVRSFRAKPEKVEAEVFYEVKAGVPVFNAIEVGGEPVPVSYASVSELIRAYAGHLSCSM